MGDILFFFFLRAQRQTLDPKYMELKAGAGARLQPGPSLNPLSVY